MQPTADYACRGNPPSLACGQSARRSPCSPRAGQRPSLQARGTTRTRTPGAGSCRKRARTRSARCTTPQRHRPVQIICNAATERKILGKTQPSHQKPDKYRDGPGHVRGPVAVQPTHHAEEHAGQQDVEAAELRGQVQPPERVVAQLIGRVEAHGDQVDDAAAERERHDLQERVEPVAAAVVGQVALVPQDGAEAEEEHKGVELQRLERQAGHRALREGLEDQEGEAEGAHERAHGLETAAAGATRPSHGLAWPAIKSPGEQRSKGLYHEEGEVAIAEQVVAEEHDHHEARPQRDVALVLRQERAARERTERGGEGERLRRLRGQGEQGHARAGGLVLAVEVHHGCELLPAAWQRLEPPPAKRMIRRGMGGHFGWWRSSSSSRRRMSGNRPVFCKCPTDVDVAGGGRWLKEDAAALDDETTAKLTSKAR
ncbi:hypothetical protein ON010_g14315 [Phytophthora cinnamomi]|nr:hypothetical protein ON010_g14315 [Phytophthora cinnamomi]